MHPAALLAGGRTQLAELLPEAKRAIGDGEFGRDRQTSVLQIEQQFTPVAGLDTLDCRGWAVLGRVAQTTDPRPRLQDWIMMVKRKLGNSGLEVSALALGCMG